MTVDALTGTPAAARRTEHFASRKSRRRELAPSGTRLVMGSLLVLLVIRFFSEGIGLLPRAVTFIDVPIFFVLVIAAVARPNAQRPKRNFFGPGLLFFSILVVSVLANLSRVAPAPALTFAYDFLAPLSIYFAVYRLWPPGNALVFSKFLVAVGIVQFLAVALIDLPRFVSDRNPDDISGTFGDNAYQLVFFLLVLTALVAAICLFERERPVARFAPLVLIAIAAIIFLAQYRAILATTMLTVLVIAFFLMKARPGRGLFVGTLMVVAFLGSLGYVAKHFPRNKLTQTVDALQADPWFFVSARLHAVDDVRALYSDNPRFVVTGTGPGTFSSRAWRTFADLSETRTAVAAPYVRSLNGGAAYETDVAQKYTVPRLESAPVVQGSRAVTTPFSSYSSLLAEVGVFGFVAYVGLYLLAVFRSSSLLMRVLRRPLGSGDPLPALLLASTIAFVVLLQLAALENWLEVTRITFLSWSLLAVVTRESEAREGHRNGA